MEKLYNVYVWHCTPAGQRSSAVRVKECVGILEANDTLDAYFNRGDGEWDGYVVERFDDPGWSPAHKFFSENEFEEFAKSVSEFWDDMMPILCMEELGELVQAISKVERDDKEDSRVERLIDEMGDVLISVWALALSPA